MPFRHTSACLSRDLKRTPLTLHTNCTGILRRWLSRHGENIKLTLCAIAIFILFGIAGEMDYQDHLRAEQGYQNQQ